MTDKQIIDGMDVSGCKYFSKYQKIVRNNKCIVDIQNACIEEIETKPCSQKNNCYFKNWQRKDKECEKAKQNAQDTYELYQALMESFNILQGEKIKLEQECEELTSKCSQLKQILENIAKGKIDKYSCAEEYAQKILKEV